MSDLDTEQVIYLLIYYMLVIHDVGLISTAVDGYSANKQIQQPEN